MPNQYRLQLHPQEQPQPDLQLLRQRQRKKKNFLLLSPTTTTTNILSNIKKQNSPTTQSEILKKLTDLNEKIDDLIELYLLSTSDTILNFPANNIEELMLKTKLLENLAHVAQSA